MKVLKPSDLPGLSREVCDWVALGVYSLYELPTDEPRYVLLTSQWAEFYFLSSRGDIMLPPKPVASVAELKLGAPVAVLRERRDVRMHVD
jgi:hypothetical protein